MLSTIRQRLAAYFRKFVFLEGLGEPQKSPRSSPATASSTLPETEGNGRGISELDQGALPPLEAPNGHTNVTELRKHQWDENTLTVLGTDIHTGEQVTISLEDQHLGQYVIGATGKGKTTLVDHMIHSVTGRGHGACLIDPHFDLVRSVISRLPQDRLKDVQLVDITDADFPVGINLFSCPQPRAIKNIAAVSSFVSHVFEKVWGAGNETPRLMMVLRAITHTLIENSPEATFCEIPLLLQHEGIRQVMAKNLTNSSIASFWESYNHRSQRDRDELTASTLNKIVSFLDQDLIRNIVGQSKTSLNFRQIMDEGKILLVSLSPQYEEASRLLGSVLIGQILMAAFSRSDIPQEEDRRPFFLFCDEYQRFATSDFATLLAEARKFRIITVLANQTLTQLDEINQAAALQAGNIVSFRTNGEDSKILSKSYDSTPGMEEIGVEPLRSPAADVISHLVTRGHGDARVTAFGQNYLASLERFCHTLPNERHHASHDCFAGSLILRNLDVSRGRARLNDALYAAQTERQADITIAPLAIYVLATAQGNTMEFAFSRYLDTETREFFGEHYMRSCERMAAFGTPTFLDRASGFVSTQTKKTHWMAQRIVSMLTELRYVLTVLSEYPILVDTGQYVPQMRQRSYHDQENLIANELSTLPRYTARVRLISGREHTIRTLPAPKQLSEHEIDERIAAIKQRMLFFGICKPYAQVQREIDLRQTMWRERAEADIPPPPPLHTNGNSRRNGRQKSPARSSTGG